MSRPNEPSRPDLYTRITHQIVAQLEAGVRPWSQPWAASESVSRPLRHDGTPYRGVNVVLLWGEAAARGFQSSTWMTFRQALALGAHVRKGEKGSTVVYADQLVRIDDDDAGEETTRRIPFLKAYNQIARALNTAVMDGAVLDLELAQLGAFQAEISAWVEALGEAFEGNLAYWAPAS